jgi:ribosomal protein S18 acetylase RimI-like enzyme
MDEKGVMLEIATPEEAPAIASLHAAVAERLTRQYGKGHWSSAPSERGVLSHMKTAKVYVARSGRLPIATLSLATKKPWAIDKSYFSPCKKPLYLTNMAVTPDLQRSGIGRLCIADLRRVGREWPGEAIFLDAYDAEGGAGGFYRKCGFREVGRVSYRNVPLIYFEMLL